MLTLLSLAEQVASEISLTVPRACVLWAGIFFPIFPLAGEENANNLEIFVSLERIQKPC